jgi:glycosyltransferase involved in cell wall biosynthesis
VASSIRRHKSGLNKPMQVILNGVNVDHFVPGLFDGREVRRALQIPNDSFVIGTIAVFRFQKRLDLWMEIAKEILNDLPNAHFIIVGDGPLKSLLIQKRKELGLEERIHFAGLQTEVRPYIAAFDIYMMSSIFEGLPIALLETMSSGCPVITTDAGGVKEVITQEVNGLLCDVDEPERLKDFAIQLANSAEKRKKLAAEGRRRIEQSFSMHTMVMQLERLYEETKSTIQV